MVLDTNKQEPGNENLSDEIKSALSSLYGFNLGFAVEASRDNVIRKVNDTLDTHNNELFNLLNEIIDQKVAEYKEYKIGVEERSANTPQIDY